ncbi:MAG: carbohydrate binding family 9 domain-containing protein [Ignavibacteria bacterium]|nr:carbohydrate binding family 9 domain-containing protein [Ignavibacteria bacterium]
MRSSHLLFLPFLLMMYLVSTSTAVAGDSPRTVRAVRVNTPPRIDGVLNDEVWKVAEPTSDFIQRDPEEGKPASERSEIRVLYDDEALYFGCMYYDSEPNKIVARLTRRDNEVESDRASIRIDSYHDHQTGYEFTFNAAGVKIDILQYDDANREDDSWDPVWDIQTKLTDQGWVAEVKIPFRILHYRPASLDSADNVWGINFLRYISRKQESERWAFTPKSQSGFISRYGHLIGLRDLPTPRQFEVLPFITSKESYNPASTYQMKRQDFLSNAGVDLKYGLSSSFTLDATVNPDFGQVEADPAVLNLSTFETFYPEKRPFFI